MKTTIIFFLCMIGSLITFGQNQKVVEETTCTPPKFTGIKSTVPMIVEGNFPTIEQYLRENATYPEEARAKWIQGTEVVKFIVTPKGEISNIDIINSVSQEIDDEVISTLQATSGMWKPGNNSGTPVAMEKEISLVFRLEDSNSSFNNLGRRYYSGGANMLFMKQNPKKALKYFDKGITLFPNDKSILALRGLTRFELGDKNGAISDWTRIKNLGGMQENWYLESFINMRGYAEMNRVLGN